MDKKPEHFQKMTSRYGKVLESLKKLSDSAHEAGPVDEKTAQLIQLAAAAAIRAEGAVHSHTKRARAAGATPEEIRQTVLMLVTTVGYPTMAAAMSWVDDILED